MTRGGTDQHHRVQKYLPTCGPILKRFNSERPAQDMFCAGLSLRWFSCLLG